MPYDPTLPINNSLITATELRNQFNGLKEIIDAQSAQIATQTAQIAALQAELALVPPGKAEIINATSIATGELEVEVAANRAIDMIFYRKGPGDADFVEEFVNGLTFGVTGLASGVHTVKAAGMNAGGVGPISDPADVTVS